MKKLTLFSALVLGAFSLAASVDAAEYNSNGSVTFTPNTDVTDPVDPTDPTNPVDPVDPTDPDGPDPGTAGPLSIDFASSLDFGTQVITSADQTYAAAAQELADGRLVPNYVQVTDSRGTGAGWSLTLTQDGQFATAENDVLTGAEITFADGLTITSTDSAAPSNLGGAAFTLTPGTAQPIMAAKAGEGLGTHLFAWGTDETTAAEAIELFVPGSTTKYAKEYRTTFTWTLTDTPGN